MANIGDFDATTETATEGEIKNLVAHRESGAQLNISRRVVLSSLFLSTLCTAAAAMAIMRPGLLGISPVNESLKPEGSYVSYQSDKTYKKTARTGCNNWESTLLKKLTGQNVVTCEQACKATAGCAGFGLQPGDCGTAGLGEEAGACYLWFGACDKGRNVCWDQYDMSPPNLGPWNLTDSRTGCSNWASIQLGATTTELSSGACALLCQGTYGCAAFNYQPGPCTGGEMVGKGACMLFEGTAGSDFCQKESNNCWDFYAMMNTTAQATTGLTDSIKVGDTTIYVADQSLFKVGDTILISNGVESQQFIITAIGSITLDQAALFVFDILSTVVSLLVSADPTPAPAPSATTAAPTAATTAADTTTGN